MAHDALIRRRSRTALLSTSLLGVMVAASIGSASAQADPLPSEAWFAAQLQQHLERETADLVSPDPSGWVAQLQDHLAREHGVDGA